MKLPRKYILVAMILLALGLFVWLVSGKLEKYIFKPTGTDLPAGVNSQSNGESGDIGVVSSNLDIPWTIAELPDGDFLVTERPGTLKRIGKNQQTFEISGVEHSGEGGLLGLVLHPDFSNNKKIYLYLTTKTGGGLTNRVESYIYSNNNLSNKTTIIERIPGASFHDGGFMAFGLDGKLYITTGDAGNEQNAQDTASLSGKILRLNDDGSTPADNPFGNAVYSYGHRNPQGLTWDNQGRLWSSEHGPSGANSGNDEINLIKKGGNYGWPVIRGQQTKQGMISPIIESGTDETWAPGAIAYLDGSLYFNGLRGQTLYQAKIISDNELQLKSHLRENYGRLRAITIGSDGFIYISTSNRDGRGEVNKDDDKIIKINPDFLK